MHKPLPTAKWILVFSLSIICSLASKAADFRRGDSVEVNGVINDLLFLSGQNVRSSAQSNNDLFMAGGNVTQSGGGAENLFAAGGNIDLINPKIRMGIIAGGNLTVSEAQAGDLIMAGGRIRVDRTRIQNNAILAGGQIDIGPGTVIENSTVLGGRQIFFSGKAAGDVEIAGNEVHLTGDFSRNVRVHAQRLVIGPNTRIGGTFSHAVEDLEVSPSATILGRDEALPLTETPGAQTSRTVAVISALFFVLGLLLAPALVAFVFPNFIQGANNHLRLHFWEDVGKGTVALILAPIVLVLLFTSVIGVPVAFFALPFFVVASLVAWSIAIFAIGLQLRIWYFRGKHLSSDPTVSLSPGKIFGWTLLGALAATLILFLPVIGAVFCLILFLAGIGSIYSQMRGSQRPRTAPTFKERPTGFAPAGSPV